MALNLRVLTIGGLISFVGSILWKVQASPWIRGNLSGLSDALTTLGTPIQLAIIFGAVVVSFGLFWGRWVLASIFGGLFALTIYVLTFL